MTEAYSTGYPAKHCKRRVGLRGRLCVSFGLSVILWQTVLKPSPVIDRLMYMGCIHPHGYVAVSGVSQNAHWFLTR